MATRPKIKRARPCERGHGGGLQR
uniref:UORF n=1 Tax=Trypanosoma cruzi TaxID=5693 RepID=A0A076JJU9_TRYCR|nr:uORF [Trypanosoma cruzi]AII77580.1 uORF [Trypanosoma cruzi]AII77585.1 uORF [Trypanosoma cruzi]AII77590.1 uORF [Trypanosoma cruzi]AII77595.1 uORF [Trypanosoma cruzi]